ncbi:hypothetical protein D3C76_1407620 [compost metagenome]
MIQIDIAVGRSQYHMHTLFFSQIGNRVAHRTGVLQWHMAFICATNLVERRVIVLHPQLQDITRL